MANIASLFPSKYLKAGADIEDGQTAVLTITHLAMESIGQDEDEGPKPVLHFKECEKGLVLNKTNAKAIAGFHGPDFDTWPGKRISLIAMDVQYGDKIMLGLRVRSTAPKADAPAGLPSKAAAGEAPKF